MHDKEALSRWAADRLATLGLGWFGAPARPHAAVVGIDGSKRSLHAAQWAAALSPRVHLLAALERPAKGKSIGAGESESWDDVAFLSRAEAEDLLEAARAHLGGDPALDTIASGGAARAIADRAEETGASLLCIGTGEKGRLSRALLGSVSESLVHHADRSVLVAREGPERGGPIVVGLGDDASSSDALAWGVALAHRLERPLVVAHASADGMIPRAFFSDEKAAQAVAIEHPAKKRLVALATDVGASLVIVGHGHRPSWLGSTAIAVVRNAPCSVLIARPLGVRE